MSTRPNLSIANDIVPIAQFKTDISRWFKNLRTTGHPIVITQNGKPAGVLLSPAEFDGLFYRHSFLDSIARGMADATAGHVYTTQDIKAVVANKRKIA